MKDHETIRAARRRLGRQLAAWRLKAGLTQRELAYRMGFSRNQIASAESGAPASRDLVDAADRVLGAGGRLTAVRNAITAAAAAARSETARQTRARAAALAGGDGPSVPGPVVSTEGG